MIIGTEKNEQIETQRKFEEFLKSGRNSYRKCDFRFPIRSDSLPRGIFEKKDISFSEVVFFEDFQFSNIMFGKHVNFLNTIFAKDIYFSNSTFNESVLFFDVDFESNFLIKDCAIQNLEIISPSLKTIHLIGNKFSGKFKLSQSEKLQHGNPARKIEIGQLEFAHNTIGENALIRFGYLNIRQFNFLNTRNPTNAEINIGDCNFHNLSILNLRNIGKFKIYRINIPDKSENTTQMTKDVKLKITNSSFGDSEFQDVYFDCYDRALIQDNLFSDLKYTDVKWPEKISTDPEDKIEKKRNTYRVLKNIAQQNNDVPQSMEFYAKEMRCYFESLRGVKGKLLDKIILYLNRLTNNFGLNWGLPILWISLSGAFFYGLLLWSISPNIDYADVCGKFFVFLNPTHDTEFIGKENSWNGWSYFFDFTFRVIEAPLIYQTIIAFRKFTRKL